MTFSALDSALLGPLFATDEMRACFSDRARLAAMLAAEAALAQAEASFGLAGRAVEIHTYEGVSHHFAESGTPGFDRRAADLAWDRTIEFLRAHGA